MFWLPDRIRHLKYRSITILSHIQVLSPRVHFHLEFNRSHFYSTCTDKLVKEKKRWNEKKHLAMLNMANRSYLSAQLPLQKKRLRETQLFLGFSFGTARFNQHKAVFISPSNRKFGKNPPNWGRQAEKAESSSHSTAVPPTWRTASLTGSRGARSMRTDRPRWPGVRLQLITSLNLICVLIAATPRKQPQIESGPFRTINFLSRATR